MKNTNNRNINALLLGALLVLSQSSCTPNEPSAKIQSDTNAQSAFQVAFLIMDGVYNTELTAPYDIFHHTKFREGIKPMRVFTIAKSHETVQTFEGINIIPDYSYLEDYPEIDILVVPSAEHHLDTDLEDVAMLEFVKHCSADAKYVTSHCDGAFVLAKAGLLDSTACTTFPSDVKTMRSMFPFLDIRDKVLFVHDGKFITSAGGAKSFEASLYLIQHMYGRRIAEQIAGGLVIDWDLENLKYLKLEGAQ